MTAAALVLTACAAQGPEKIRPTDPISGTNSGSGGTTSPNPGPGPSDDAPLTPEPGFDPLAGTDPALADFYGQALAWEDCGSKRLCADVTVPLDYSNPSDGRTVNIRVGVLSTAGSSDSGLFLNPGGPGGSGFDMLDWITSSLSSQLASTYNMVGFDPRGVNHSDAVACLSDAEWDARNTNDLDISTPEGMQSYIDGQREFVDKCVANTPGDLLEFVDTDSAVRDLDILRAVVGQKSSLDFLGYSYGTFLGAHYAELFPERVGAFVLDGAVDPSLGIRGIALGQAGGFELAVRAFMEDCLQGNRCPFTGTVDDGLDQLDTFFEMAGATPIPTSDPNRPLTASLAVTAVILGMYESGVWSILYTALDAAMNDNDGSQLLYWADLANSRLPDGTYEDNSSDAFLAIQCLDYPVEGTFEDWEATAEEMKEISPFWQDSFAYTEVTCDMWPYEAKLTPAPLSASGSAPILVIGTTGDSATPYEWSVALADQLENGHLLTYEGFGHTAYGRSNSCIADAVDAYLIDGTLPEPGKTC